MFLFTTIIRGYYTKVLKFAFYLIFYKKNDKRYILLHKGLNKVLISSIFKDTKYKYKWRKIKCI